MRKIFFTGLTALALIAYGCSEQEVDPTTDSTVNGNLRGYVSFNLQSSTRTTPGDDGTETGETNENAVSDVTIVFTSSSGGIIAVARNVGLVASTTVTNPVEINIGTYEVYALVNVEGFFTTIQSGVNQNIHQAITVSSAANATSGFFNGSFFMTNERNTSTVSGGIPVTINATHTATSPAQISINLDRAAVKIEDLTVNSEVTLGTGITGAGVASVEVTGFVPLNINRQFNLIQEWSNQNENNADDPTLSSTEVLHTPVYNSSNPVADQFFHPVSDYTEVVMTGSDITSVTDLTTTDPGSLYVKLVYATENRPTILFKLSDPELTAGRGETTGVIFRVQCKDAGNANLATFYAYNGVYYSTLAEIQDLPDFTGTDLSTLTNPQRRALGISVYENGVMYYTYFILDPNSSHRYLTNNYYGVFRNSIYRLNITRLNNLGDDVPGGTEVNPGDPNPPIDSDETYLQVTLNVNPWVLNLIDLEL